MEIVNELIISFVAGGATGFILGLIACFVALNENKNDSDSHPF